MLVIDENCSIITDNDIFKTFVEVSLADVKERGGDTDKIKVEIEKLATDVKDLEFRSSGQDKIIQFEYP